MPIERQVVVAATDISAACSIAVLYEDRAARDFAILACDSIVQKFLADLEFDFSWWHFTFLSDPEIAKMATQAALKADIVLVVLHFSSELTFESKAWFERWASERQEAGALAVLRLPWPKEGLGAPDDSYLRLVAIRAGLDYLAELPSGNEDRLREDAAVQVTPRYFPNHRHHSSGWGINE